MILLLTYTALIFAGIISGQQSNTTISTNSTNTTNTTLPSPVSILQPVDIPEGFLEKLPRECGQNRFRDTVTATRSHIFGKVARLGEFPWIVRLGKIIPGRKPMFMCTATLITRYYVVSAAHCDDIFDIVRVGENYVNVHRDCDSSGVCAPPYQDVEIKRYIFQDFCREVSYNDLMLIELMKTVYFNDFVQPACLPRAPIAHENFKGQAVSIAGWVHDMETYEVAIPPMLYIVNPVLEPTECASNVTTPFTLQESQFCIGTPGVVKSNRVCPTGTGDPITVGMDVDGKTRAHLIGVVSYSNPHCDSAPAAFTDTTFFVKWIVDNIVMF